MPWRPEHKDPAYGRAPWKKARSAQMRRDGGRCQLRLPGICLGAASQVDHIFGLRNDPGHKFLRSVCVPCHRAITRKLSSGNGSNGSSGVRHNEPPAEPRTDWGAP